MTEMAQGNFDTPHSLGNVAAPSQITQQLPDLVKDADIVPASVRSPAAQAARLRGFAAQHDDTVWAALMTDPNTAPEILQLLAGTFPAEFCANPIFPLLLLENPNLPAEMDAASLGSLLAYTDIPEDFLTYIAN
jgi:hypothetical protein